MNLRPVLSNVYRWSAVVIAFRILSKPGPFSLDLVLSDKIKIALAKNLTRAVAGYVLPGGIEISDDALGITLPDKVFEKSLRNLGISPRSRVTPSPPACAR